MLVDWETHGRLLRLQAADDLRQPSGRSLVQRVVTVLRSRSEQFERWWNENEIVAMQEGVKHYEHPEAGRLVFDFSVLEVMDEADVIAPAGGLRAGTGQGARGRRWSSCSVSRHLSCPHRWKRSKPPQASAVVRS